VDSGCLPQFEEALSGGANVNAKDENRVPLLLHAVAKGRRIMVQMLLAAGADPNLADWSGNTSVFRILSRPSPYRREDLTGILANQVAILDVLLAAKADINARRMTDKQTVLFDAARFNADDGSAGYWIKALIARGSEVGIRDQRGQTALMHAVLHVRPEVLAETLPILIAAGADVNVKDSAGKTPLQYVQKRAKRGQDFSEVTQLLIAAGAKL
jgi:ankyrin repeat protein